MVQRKACAFCASRLALRRARPDKGLETVLHPRACRPLHNRQHESVIEVSWLRERTRKVLSCLFSLIASYIYVGSKESTTLVSFFPSSRSSLGLSFASCCSGCCDGSDSFSLNTNSSKNLIVASTSGVAPLSISGPPAPCCSFRSLYRFQKGGACTSNCNIALARHTFSVFASPRARRRGRVASPVAREGIVPPRKARDSEFGKGGI